MLHPARKLLDAVALPNHGGDVFARLESAAQNAATSAYSRTPPTLAQREASNYAMGHAVLHGVAVRIENPRNTFREGIGADGKPWRTRLAAHYGDFPGTRGNDGDPVDGFFGPFPESTAVWVVNQRHVGGNEFDEHKAMLGFVSERQARDAYQDSFDRDWAGLMSIVPATINQFKWWLKSGDKSRPFSAYQLPIEGPSTMKTLWNNDAEPVTTTLHQLMYALRVEDGKDGLMLDAVTMNDLMGDPDIEGVVTLDALVVEVNRMTLKMDMLKKVMEAAGGTVKPTEVTISDPVKARGVLQVMALFQMSDGQTIAIWFHNPDTTPSKLTPMDELVSWKWLLNKKDVTIVVAPERGVELNVREVARRVMRLVERNSEAYQKANAKAGERAAEAKALDDEIVSLEGELTSLNRQIEVAKVKKEDASAEVARQIKALIAEQDRVLKLLEAEKGFGLGSDTVKLEALMNQYDDLADKIRAMRGEAAEGRSSWATWKALRDAEEARNSPSLLIKTAIANALSQTDGKVETSDALVWALSKSSLNKMVASNNKDGEKPFQKERILAIQSIQAIANTAVSPVVRPDDNNSPEIEAIFEYLSTFETGGKTYKVRLLCKKFVKDSTADDKMHSLKLDGVPADQVVPDGLLISLEIIGDVAELGNPDLSLPPSAEGKDTLAKVKVEVKPAEIDPEIRREMDDELTYARQGKFSLSYLADKRSGDMTAFFASYEDERVAHEAALASAWEGRSQAEDNSSIAIVDAAYLFASATDAFKKWVADSVDDADYSPFVTAKAMDLKAKELGLSIEWGVGQSVLDSAGDAGEPDGGDEEVFNEADEWDATPDTDDDENELTAIMDGDFRGHPFRGNQFKHASHESGAAVRSSMRAKHAERKGDSKAASKAHASAHYSHRAAAVSATGKAKSYHKKMAKFHGARSGVKVLDAVLDDAGETSQLVIGQIKQAAKIIGRAMIGGDGKAMVYLGASGTERVKHPTNEAVTVRWSDDDAADMVAYLAASMAPADETPVPAPEETDASRLRADEALVSKGAITSDDPQAIEKLQAKLTALQARQEFMKKANKFLKTGNDAGLLAMGITQVQIDNLKKAEYAGRTGFADYLLTNNNGVISSTRKRLESMMADRLKEQQEAAVTPEPVSPVVDLAVEGEKLTLKRDIEGLEATLWSVNLAGERREERIAEIAEKKARLTEISATISEPTPVSNPDKDADTAYLKSLIDGTTDMFAADIFDKLEPLFVTYESDANMMALLTQASEAYVASSVTAAKAALAAM